VNELVEPRHGGTDRRRDRPGAFRHSGVGLDEMRYASGGRHRGDRLFGRFVVAPVVQKDVLARRGECLGDRQPDTLRAAGNQDRHHAPPATL